MMTDREPKLDQFLLQPFPTSQVGKVGLPPADAIEASLILYMT
jgi:hypothetical protein